MPNPLYDYLQQHFLIEIINIVWPEERFATFTVFLAATLSPHATEGGPPDPETPDSPILFPLYATTIVPLVDNLISASQGFVTGAPATVDPEVLEVPSWTTGGGEWEDLSAKNDLAIDRDEGSSVTVAIKNRYHYLNDHAIEWGPGLIGSLGEFYSVAAAPTLGSVTISWSHVRLNINGTIYTPVGFRAETREPDDDPAEDPYNAPDLVEGLTISIRWEPE